MTGFSTRSGRLLWLAAGLSLAAVGLGAWVCAGSGIPTALWARNLVAWLVGAAVAYGLARTSGGRVLPAILVLSALALAATLIAPGQLGVHRWIALGPLSLNIGFLLLPAALVALAALARDAPWIWAHAFVCLALLVAQPDASQASAFGAAMVWIALRVVGGVRARAAIVLGTLLLVAGAWMRPDPLQPVPEVEEILRLAYAVSPALAAAALAALLLFAVTPALIARGGARDAGVAGGALSLYLLACAAAPFVGAFPVPLVGVGLSPILGAWIGVGVLAARLRAKAESAP